MDHPRDAEGHRYFEGLAVSHVLGGLDEPEGRVFRSHLLECGVCRARVGELRAIAHELADVERDERRVKAARAIETKRREVEEETPEPAPSSPRALRVAGLLGLVVIMGLAAWAFTLRGTVTNLQLAVDQLLKASTVRELGAPWRVVHAEAGVDGTVKVHGNEMVVLLDGLESERLYNVHVLSPRGEQVFNQPMRPTNGRLFPLIPLREPAATVVVTLSADGQPAREPSGPPVFQAESPLD